MFTRLTGNYNSNLSSQLKRVSASEVNRESKTKNYTSIENYSQGVNRSLNQQCGDRKLGVKVVYKPVETQLSIILTFKN